MVALKECPPNDEVHAQAGCPLSSRPTLCQQGLQLCKHLPRGQASACKVCAQLEAVVDAACHHARGFEVQDGSALPGQYHSICTEANCLQQKGVSEAGMPCGLLMPTWLL